MVWLFSAIIETLCGGRIFRLSILQLYRLEVGRRSESCTSFTSSTSYTSITRAMIFTDLTGQSMTDPGKTPFCTVEEAVEEIRNGRMIVLVDHAHRENEGHLTMAAEQVTPAPITSTAQYAPALI